MRKGGYSGTIRPSESRRTSRANAPSEKRRALRFAAMAVAVVMLFFLSACGGALKDTAGEVHGEGEEASETPRPDAEADPDDHPEPPPKETETREPGASVDFARQNDGVRESAVITGLSRDGGSVWTYATGQYEATQLDRVNDLGAYGDTYYFVEDGTVTALRVTDGALLWKNDGFGGSASAHAFDGEGNMYLSGYFGPDLFVVGPNGATVRRIDSFDSAYYWPKRLDYQGTQLALTFEGTPSGSDETVYVSLLDYATSIAGSAPPGQAANVSMSAVTGASASSYLVEAQYGVSHGPECVIDGSLSTGWVENVSGQGEGQSVTLSLDGVYRVSGFTINAGYQKSSDLYYKNSRPATVLVSFSDGSSVRIDLEDHFGQQSFTFDSHVETGSVTFTIESVYAGSKYQDTVISEISLF